MAAGLGFEPRQYESESQVLPLHHSPSAWNRQRAFLLNCEVKYNTFPWACQHLFSHSRDDFGEKTFHRVPHLAHRAMFVLHCPKRGMDSQKGFPL